MKDKLAQECLKQTPSSLFTNTVTDSSPRGKGLGDNISSSLPHGKHRHELSVFVLVEE